MNERKLSRRSALTQAGLMVSAGLASDHLSVAHAAGRSSEPKGPKAVFRFCLNTATIRGQKLGIVKEIELASKAGYDGIEPWVDGIDDYAKAGGKLEDLKKIISDRGLVVESAIGFPEWIVDDDARRAKGMERAKREMDMVAKLGGKRFAAPPAGATDLPKLDLLKAAERYWALLELGAQVGVVPQLELWGFSKNLNRLGECVCVAIETGHPNACVLADVFHLHKGGSNIEGVRLLGPETIQVLHMNDYPSDPPREKIDDSFRVYPGDGTAPIVDLLRLLRNSGGEKILSLETFNRGYWGQDPLEVVKTGLAKMKAVLKKATA